MRMLRCRTGTQVTCAFGWCLEPFGVVAAVLGVSVLPCSALWCLAALWLRQRRQAQCCSGSFSRLFLCVAQLNQAFLAHTVPVDVSSPSPLSGYFGAVIWLFALRSAAFSVPPLPLPDAWPVLSEML